jgi:hypothetical protein
MKSDICCFRQEFIETGLIDDPGGITGITGQRKVFNILWLQHVRRTKTTNALCRNSSFELGLSVGPTVKDRVDVASAATSVFVFAHSGDGHDKGEDIWIHMTAAQSFFAVELRK